MTDTSLAPSGLTFGASHDVVVLQNVMVKMRDGVQLATDIYLPAADGIASEKPRPVLLYRTPYDKTETEARNNRAHQFVRAGYVAIMQDCRGCFRSEGEVNFVFPEAEDGQDTVNWIRKQPWCDGQVATWGTSWCGWTQTAMAAVGTEGLAAMVPCQSGFNGHSSSVRQGGAMELRWLAWAFWHSAGNFQVDLKRSPSVETALNFGATPFSDWLRRWPIRPGATELALVPPYERWAFELLTHGSYDQYWRHPSINPSAHIETFTDAPTLLLGGWYDSYARASLELFATLLAAKRGPVKLIMGPWVHGMIEEPYAGDVWLGHHSVANSLQIHLRWYDRWLKNVDNGAESDAPLRIFVMGGGSGTRGPENRLDHGGVWREEHEWPLARTHFTAMYLHENGTLSEEAPTTSTASTTYRFDPSNPVPSIGGSNSSLMDLGPLPAHVSNPHLFAIGERREALAPGGGFDQHESAASFGCKPPYLPLSSRADVLVFQTAPLREGVEVTGPIEVKLWVSSSALDTDMTAKLIDQYPPSDAYPRGYALNLTDSIVRLRYRNGGEAPQLLTPEEVVPVTITLYPTSNFFAAGHRIRLDISSSNFPRFDVNPNTGEPLGKERRRVVADNTVFHDAVRPSHIILPIIPRA